MFRRNRRAHPWSAPGHLREEIGILPSPISAEFRIEARLRSVWSRLSGQAPEANRLQSSSARGVAHFEWCIQKLPVTFNQDTRTKSAIRNAAWARRPRFLLTECSFIFSARSWGCG